MGWKDWEYSSKGALIGFLVNLIILITYFINLGDISWGFIAMPFIIFGSSVFMSVMGALVGWIYGKFKNRIK